MKTFKTLRWLLLWTVPLAAQVHLGGYLETYNRYWVHADSGRWTWNENRLQIQLEGSPSENLHFYGELRLRGFGFPQTDILSDLQRLEKDRVYPWSLEIREVYADLYDFVVPGLDLRIGRQVIAWGTADKINPTSNLSPYDFEDFFDFGAKLGVNALRAMYTHEPWSFELDFVPVFTPAVLPHGAWSSAFMGPGMPVPDTTPKITPPVPNMRNAQMGVKLSTTLWDWDFSASYYRGFDGLPMPDTIAMDFFPSVRVHMRYPKIQVFGLDFAGSLGHIGVWGEGALFVPETFISWIIPPDPPFPFADTLLHKDRPYLKFVFGGDYTFNNGLYLNAQYIHGFLHERGPDSLNDYVVLRTEKKFLDDQLTLAPLTVAVEIPDWSKTSENYGFAWIPEVKFAPTDNVELRLGAFVLDGKGTSLFTRLKDHDEVYFRVKLSF